MYHIWILVQGTNRWGIPIPALICHTNQSNECYITKIHGYIEIMSQRPIR